MVLKISSSTVEEFMKEIACAGNPKMAISEFVGWLNARAGYDVAMAAADQPNTVLKLAQLYCASPQNKQMIESIGLHDNISDVDAKRLAKRISNDFRYRVGELQLNKNGILLIQIEYDESTWRTVYQVENKEIWAETPIPGLKVKMWQALSMTLFASEFDWLDAGHGLAFMRWKKEKKRGVCLCYHRAMNQNSPGQNIILWKNGVWGNCR